jgi:chemotaxis methyl-accepting protein methylase
LLAFVPHRKFNASSNAFFKTQLTSLLFYTALKAIPATSQLAALVEDLTNHETYFFRERAHLNALEDVVIPASGAEERNSRAASKKSLSGLPPAPLAKKRIR